MILNLTALSHIQRNDYLSLALLGSMWFLIMGKFPLLHNTHAEWNISVPHILVLTLSTRYQCSSTLHSPGHKGSMETESSSHQSKGGIQTGLMDCLSWVGFQVLKKDSKCMTVLTTKEQTTILCGWSANH